MAILAILPLLVIAFIFFGSYLLQKYTHKNGIRYAMFAFPIILLISTIVYYLLPTDKFVYGYDPFIDDEKEHVEYSGFQEAVAEGRINELDTIKVRENWNFEYASEQLEISVSEDVYTWVVIERKNENDGLIEVNHFQAKNYVDGMEMTNIKNNYQVTLEGETLRIIPPKPYEVKISAFKPDFVLTQFQEKGKNGTTDFMSVDPEGYQVIYLRVPKELELTGATYLQFVGEEE
jgi:hypothetical protein